MLVKRIATCIYFQPFPSNSTCKFKSSSFLHFLAFRGYAPGKIAVNVTWMERGFNAKRVTPQGKRTLSPPGHYPPP